MQDDHAKKDDQEEVTESAKVDQNIKEDQQEDEKNPPSPKKDDQDSRIEELTHALARAMADLQNFKRRNEEERAGLFKYANIELLKSLLPFIDNLDRSIFHLPEDLKENQWTKGVIHIHADLLKTLETLGIQKIKTVGEKLDPLKHEGLMSGPGEKDIIIEEFEPGYIMGDTVIKVARVKVGDGTEK